MKLKYLAILLVLCLALSGCNTDEDGDNNGNKDFANKENNYAGYTQIAAIDSGISWPEGQAVPIFSTPAEKVDLILEGSLTSDERITFSALEGHVNKEKTRMLIAENTKWTKVFEVETETYKKADKYELMKKYKDNVKGMVLYDATKSKHYRNLASTIANVKGYIPVSVKIKEKLDEAGFTFTEENTVDITGLEYTTPDEIYDYLYDNYWKDCTKRLIISADPAADGTLIANRDIAAAVGAAVVFCATLTDSGKAQYEKFLKDMSDSGDTSMVLGWFPSERSGITAATKYGIGTMPADYFKGGSFLSSLNHTINVPTVPKRAELENKAYIALYFSDGDNIQYCQNGMRDLWDKEASSRGKVALNWTIAPGLSDIAPGIMNYYYGQATDYECFVTGPSGMGYIMPQNTLEEKGAPVGEYLTEKKYADDYTKLTETYLQKSGIRVITIWDGCPDVARKSYEENCRNLYGLTVQNFDGDSVKASTENNRLRFDLLKLAYTSQYNTLYNTLKTALQEWDGQSPLFVSAQVERWKDDVNSKQLVKLEGKLKEEFPDKNFDFIRADHYFSYYNETNQMPFNLSMLSSVSVTTSDDAGSPENLTDGTPVSMWTSSKEGDKYIQLDFGKNYEINRYVLRHAEANGMDKTNNTKDWTVEVSTDGTNWTKVDEYKGNTAAVSDIDIDPVSARYVRFTVTDSGDASTVRLADVEVYGKTVG